MWRYRRRYVVIGLVVVGVIFFFNGFKYNPKYRRSLKSRYNIKNSKITFETRGLAKQQLGKSTSSNVTKSSISYSKNYTITSSKNNTRSLFIMAFDIELVISSFKACHKENLKIASYIKGYGELYNFFNVLGTVFGFIASDVKEKIDILENFQNDPEHQASYATVEVMMLHEIEVNKQTDDQLFGSRTLLRLHRALIFTKLFLERLGSMDEKDSVATMAADVYGQTLANYHPWLIRKAASFAMYSLPSRKDMVKKIAPEGIEESLLKEKITECVEALDKVYNDIEDLYTKYSLHDLP